MRPTTFLGALALTACSICPARADVVYDLIAYTGQQAPGITSVLFTNFQAFSANASGQAAFSATVYGAGTVSINDQGIWTGPPGTVALYAREQGSVPGLPATIYYGPFGALHVNANGQIVFNEQLAGGVLGFNDDSIYSGVPGGIQKVVRAGDAAPGAGAAQFGTFGPAVINGPGKIAFSATLAAGAVPGQNDLGIWAGTTGAIQLVAQSGTGQPPDTSGVLFSTFKDPALSDNGAVAFFATLTPASIQDTGIWSGGAGQLHLLARRNQAAPGTGNGPNFDVFGDPVINNAGVVCFTATLQGTGATGLSSNGIWAGTPGTGNLNLIVRAGDQAPGLASGDNFLSFGPPILNDAGQFAFVAALVGPGIGLGVNDSAVFAGTPGNLKLIAQTHGQTPGLQTGILFKSFDKILMDASGRVAILAHLEGGVDPGFDAGIWAVDSADQLQLVIWEGQTLDLPNANFVPFADNGLAMLGDRRTDFSVFGPSRIPFTATLLLASQISPVTTGVFFANLVPAGPVLAATITAGQVQLSFASTVGTIYQIQYTDSLTPINWQPLGQDVTGTGQTMVVNDALPSGSAQRYYRMVVP